MSAFLAFAILRMIMYPELTRLPVIVELVALIALFSKGLHVMKYPEKYSNKKRYNGSIYIFLICAIMFLVLLFQNILNSSIQ